MSFFEITELPATAAIKVLPKVDGGYPLEYLYDQTAPENSVCKNCNGEEHCEDPVLLGERLYDQADNVWRTEDDARHCFLGETIRQVIEERQGKSDFILDTGNGQTTIFNPLNRSKLNVVGEHVADNVELSSPSAIRTRKEEIVTAFKNDLNLNKANADLEALGALVKSKKKQTSNSKAIKAVETRNTHRQFELTREERKNMIDTLRDEYMIPSRVTFHPTFDTTLQKPEENAALQDLITILNKAVLKPSDITNIKLKTGILDQTQPVKIILNKLLSVMTKTKYRRYMLIRAWENGKDTAELLKQYRLSEDISTNHLKLYHRMANTKQLKDGVPTEEELRELEHKVNGLVGEEKEKLFSLKLALIYYERGKSETEISKKEKIHNRISYFKTKYEAMFGENELFNLLLEDLSDTK